ncbi:hypothetical protein N7450_004466 [Penicillium hetheringtonii]|uniref:Uncharacterized protein n=1 Tax=Penicillium hetheringtonii TaxID=911720 RepID=A0AAD6DQ19_9EURO|nr:hypothetical protein N7450_004466 [Penicillium hetheringtonii]
MKKEYEGYGEEKKLQALQAALVYGIICAQSMESIPNEDAAWMVEIIETFAERLYDMRTWGLDEDSVFTSRGRWTFVESLRRIGCLLYLIDLLLHLDTETPSSGDCPEFFDMPLPCVRELWEPMPTREWKKRHRDHVESAKRKGRRGLTLRHLFLLRQSSSKGQHQDFSQSNSPDFEEELSEWCEKADDLSMLLWVALTVEGKGQSYV